MTRNRRQHTHPHTDTVKQTLVICMICGSSSRNSEAVKMQKKILMSFLASNDRATQSYKHWAGLSLEFIILCKINTSIIIVELSFYIVSSKIGWRRCDVTPYRPHTGLSFPCYRHSRARILSQVQTLCVFEDACIFCLLPLTHVIEHPSWVHDNLYETSNYWRKWHDISIVASYVLPHL